MTSCIIIISIILILIILKILVTPTPQIDDYWYNFLCPSKRYNIINIDKFMVYYVDINRRDVLLCDNIISFKILNEYAAH